VKNVVVVVDFRAGTTATKMDDEQRRRSTCKLRRRNGGAIIKQIIRRGATSCGFSFDCFWLGRSAIKAKGEQILETNDVSMVLSALFHLSEE